MSLATKLCYISIIHVLHEQTTLGAMPTRLGSCRLPVILCTFYGNVYAECARMPVRWSFTQPAPKPGSPRGAQQVHVAFQDLKSVLTKQQKGFGKNCVHTYVPVHTSRPRSVAHRYTQTIILCINNILCICCSNCTFYNRFITAHITLRHMNATRCFNACNYCAKMLIHLYSHFILYEYTTDHIILAQLIIGSSSLAGKYLYFA